jgi:peroxiredoxin
LQQVLGQIVAHNATLVALTPQLPEHSRGMIAKQLLGYELLSDPGNAYAGKLGLRFALPDDLRAVYTARGLDLPKHNGEPSWTLPIPGRFVIDRTGVVRAANVDPDYTRRPEPEKTLQDLATLG